METPPYESITDEDGKVFYLVPELLTLVAGELVDTLATTTWRSRGHPPGCSACHFNRKERRQPQHPSRDAHEHCNCPVGGVINDYKCASTRNIFVTPRNLKRYQIRAVVARLTGELR
jgi:hypothetical protein